MHPSSSPSSSFGSANARRRWISANAAIIPVVICSGVIIFFLSFFVEICWFKESQRPVGFLGVYPYVLETVLFHPVEEGVIFAPAAGEAVVCGIHAGHFRGDALFAVDVGFRIFGVEHIFESFFLCWLVACVGSRFTIPHDSPLVNQII